MQKLGYCGQEPLIDLPSVNLSSLFKKLPTPRSTTISCKCGFCKLVVYCLKNFFLSIQNLLPTRFIRRFSCLSDSLLLLSSLGLPRVALIPCSTSLQCTPLWDPPLACYSMILKGQHTTAGFPRAPGQEAIALVQRQGLCLGLIT